MVHLAIEFLDYLIELMNLLKLFAVKNIEIKIKNIENIGIKFFIFELKILNFSSFECEVFIEIIAKIQYVKTKSDITASPTSCSIILENKIANKAIIKNLSSLLTVNNFNLEMYKKVIIKNINAEIPSSPFSIKIFKNILWAFEEITILS